MTSKDVTQHLAAVCGLYCGACTAYIATTEDPARLTQLAAQFQLSKEAIRCYGCRSAKRGPYCQVCKISACAAEKGIAFCSECEAYPCDDLKQFQAEAPHRLELWDDLARIKAIGWQAWLTEVEENYACPECGTINSTYDPHCRKCGAEPSCAYVQKHQPEIESFFTRMAQTDGTE